MQNNQLAEFKKELNEKEIQLQDTNTRLADPKIGDDSYIALMKTKNELVADIQALQIKISQLNPAKPFERLLNETFEL